MPRKTLAALLSAVLILLLFAGCGAKISVERPTEGEAMVTAAVLYDSAQNNKAWQDTFSQLNQSLLLDFSVEAVDVSGEYSLDNFDVLYPDVSVIKSPNASKLKAEIVSFAENGGAVLLENKFFSFFDPDFFGADSFEKLSGYPQDLKFPQVSEDLTELQGMIWDFASFYTQYADFQRLSVLDYGYAAVGGKAKVLASCSEGNLYTLNDYGKGLVLFTNPLLPNRFSVNGFSVESRSDEQISFANTGASSNQIFLNAFSGLVSKQKYGFSLSRVFGCFGRPSMAWQLHFEEITGIENNAAVLFGELAKENLQLPSYSIIRNTYTWFLRAESITYLLGEGEESPASYTMDFSENAYSSGTHIPDGDGWLSLSEIPEGGSYFSDYPEFDQRAYPWIGDLNGDPAPDIVCGSSDGLLYIYEGIGGKRYTVSSAESIKDSKGAPLKVSGYSAPVLYDIDGNGTKDVVCGNDKGELYAAMGGAEGYLPFELLLKSHVTGQCFPEIGDFDGDGRADLLLGSNEGKLLLYPGKSEIGLETDKKAIDLSGSVSDLGTWLAPRLHDGNGDGKNEIYIGTFDGYVAKAEIKDGKPLSVGYMETTEKNYKGNNRIKFANNCVPFFADLNGDGVSDLAAGSLEYGLAYPINSPYFQYGEQLQKQIDYVLENGFSIQPHFYTNAGASAEREEYELSAHRAAMEAYGIPSDSLMGVNQHTWHTSAFDLKQSFLSAYKAGFLWESGFEPSRAAYAPQTAAENVIALPFMLEDGGEETILIQNCSVVPYRDEYWQKTSAKYGMPICLYYHCDFVYRDNTEAKQMLRQAADFQSSYCYNFVSEKQLMLANAAAYNLTVSAGKTSDSEDFDITLIPGTEKTDFSLYDEAYAASCGVKISLGEKLSESNIETDAAVWYRDGNNLYASADKPFRIYKVNKAPAETHLERVNIAAEITETADGCTVVFKDGGMLQCVVAGKAETEGIGWLVKQENGKTVFTKYGEADTLNIKF